MDDLLANAFNFISLYIRIVHCRDCSEEIKGMHAWMMYIRIGHAWMTSSSSSSIIKSCTQDSI